jgi:predicted ABC-type ATPase
MKRYILFAGCNGVGKSTLYQTNDLFRNMPEGLGRYKVADASQLADDNASRTFEWYL